MFKKIIIILISIFIISCSQIKYFKFNNNNYTITETYKKCNLQNEDLNCQLISETYK